MKMKLKLSIEGYLIFTEQTNSVTMRQWDSQITVLCDEVIIFKD